ncbi:MAG: uracil-DNA glycosylase [Clostridia bacterium]|nr:uracil-DNA glycosylase [Clostridia bacterium]
MIYISKNWLELLKDEFDKDYFKHLQQFLSDEYQKTTVYPEDKKVFNAFLQTKYNEIKVVILGQDPYINENQAHGLCFSVESGAIPPSLKNIYKEIQSELGCDIPNNGNLTKWARQGVLLLNSVLTVKSGISNSHKGKGWEKFTHEVIRKIAEKDTPVVFMLWGGNAKKVVENIDLSKHFVLSSAHPSPLSASNGFFGNGHFKKCNEFLVAHGKTPIDWQIDNI